MRVFAPARRLHTPVYTGKSPSQSSISFQSLIQSWRAASDFVKPDFKPSSDKQKQYAVSLLHKKLEHMKSLSVEDRAALVQKTWISIAEIESALGRLSA